MFLQVQEFAEHNDAILLVVVPAASVREVATSKALKLAQELDSDGNYAPAFMPFPSHPRRKLKI